MRTTLPYKKLDYKKVGLFKILAKIGGSAYNLVLDPQPRSTTHSSFVFLNFPSQGTQPPPPIIIKGEPEYDLEEIIDSRLHYGKLQY